MTPLRMVGVQVRTKTGKRRFSTTVSMMTQESMKSLDLLKDLEVAINPGFMENRILKFNY